MWVRGIVFHFSILGSGLLNVGSSCVLVGGTKDGSWSESFGLGGNMVGC